MWRKSTSTWWKNCALALTLLTVVWLWGCGGSSNSSSGDELDNLGRPSLPTNIDYSDLRFEPASEDAVVLFVEEKLPGFALVGNCNEEPYIAESETGDQIRLCYIQSGSRGAHSIGPYGEPPWYRVLLESTNEGFRVIQIVPISA